MANVTFVLLCFVGVAVLAFALAGGDARTSYRVLDSMFQRDMFADVSMRHDRTFRHDAERRLENPPDAAPLESSSRRVSPLMKKKIAARDKWRCRLCGALVDHTFEIDHVSPLFLGGSNAEDNLRLLCRLCHGRVTADQRMRSASPRESRKRKHGLANAS